MPVFLAYSAFYGGTQEKPTTARTGKHNFFATDSVTEGGGGQHGASSGQVLRAVEIEKRAGGLRPVREDMAAMGGNAPVQSAAGHGSGGQKGQYRNF